MESLEPVDCMVGMKYNISFHFRPNPQARRERREPLGEQAYGKGGARKTLKSKSFDEFLDFSKIKLE